MIIPDIDTARLKLRAFTEADIPALLPLIGAREIAATTLRIAHPYTEQNARDFMAKAREADKIWLAITQRADGRLCGGVGLMLDLEHQRAHRRPPPTNRPTTLEPRIDRDIWPIDR